MQSVAGYQIIEKLYSSACIETYRCCAEEGDQKTVILKVPHSNIPTHQEIVMLQHEYHLLKTLNIPGIIRASELIEQAGYPILLLENVEGQSLQDFLAEHTLDLNNFFKVALQLVEIIEALHKKHIIHKEIKPANMLFDPVTLKITLMDLSISSRLSEEYLNYISLNMLEGTLAYMSPEQTGCMNVPIDYRTDFYSLGITFFEMLTGQLPFQVEDPLEMVHYHIAKMPPLATELNLQIPYMVAGIIAKLLAKMPEERYASAKGLWEDLAYCEQEWQERNSISEFELGCKDVHDKLQISHKLFGRDTQIKQVLNAFERVSKEGQSELLLVSGFSGIGKTAVIREVYKPIIRQRGYFISGKYDQLQRGTPYTAVIAAFQNLVKQVLGDSQENRLKIKEKILEAVGNVGQVIIDLIPEFEWILGKQPSIPILKPTEAQNRFNLVFQNLMRVFAQAEHPLVIFLDDLQWADNASLNFVENLFSDPTTRYLLLIGAYRNNEVPADHPLLATIQRLQKSEIPIELMALHPLQKGDIEQLLRETFNCEPGRVTPLAALLYEKTLGNPFFICEFLKVLHQENLIQFAHAQGEWQWDIADIQHSSITHNVLDLLTAQIQKLPTNTQFILKLAACIGHTFNLKTLAIISEQTPLQAAQALWEAMQIRYIIALEDSNKTAMLIEANRLITTFSESEILYYQFSHDRIQHAAYNLIPEATRQQTHLRIGRLLLKEHTLREQDSQLFSIVNHLNQGSVLITDASEKQLLFQYNVLAGNKAKASAAYTAALHYFESVISLLPSDAWKKEYALTLNLYKGAAECQYLVRQFEKAENFITLLLQKALPPDKTHVYIIQISAYTSVGQHHKALNIAVHVLKNFHFHLPLAPNIAHLLKEIVCIKWKVKAKKVSELATLLSKATEPHLLAINQILSLITPSAYLTNQKLYALIVCKMINLGLTCGYAPETSVACLSYAAILISKFNQIDLGFEFVLLSKNINEKLGSSPPCRYYFYMGVIIHHWKYPLKESMDYFQKCDRIALEAGDLTFAGYNCIRLNTQYYLGESLVELLSECEKIIVFSKRIERLNAYYYFLIFKEIINCLREDFSFIDKLPDKVKLITDDNKSLRVLSHNLFSQLFFLKGEFKKALEMAELVWSSKEFIVASMDSAIAFFFYALSMLSCYSITSRAEQKIYWKTINKIYQQIKIWNTYCPANFEFLYFHLSAEIAHAEHKVIEAMGWYDKAIVSAQKSDRIQFVALANERAARFYLFLNKPHLAKRYILKAYDAYHQWGAFEKCKLFEQQYPQLFQLSMLEKNTITMKEGKTTVSASSDQAFDMITALKSTLEISSEIQLDKLLQKLLHIMMTDSGANRCVLLYYQGENWVVEADGNADKQVVYLQPQAITTTTGLPLTLIEYVHRVGESILVQDATCNEQTAADPYILKVKPKSLLVLPVRYQGQLRRIFYLENNREAGTFTNQHLQMLQLLGTQAAISLENARLYYQATHDPLTGLANRNLLYQTFTDYIHSAELRQDKKIAILFLDLNRFKPINDTLGHEIGDKLLLYMAEQLKACIQEEDLAVRLGGDEFVLMVKSINDTTEITALVNNLNKLLARTTTIQGHQLSLSTSIGISVFPDEGTDIHTLLRLADIALYRDKEIQHKQYQ